MIVSIYFCQQQRTARIVYPKTWIGLFLMVRELYIVGLNIIALIMKHLKTKFLMW